MGLCWGRLFTRCVADQNVELRGAELEETRACLFALQKVAAHGLRSIIVEGDSQSLIKKLQKERHNTLVGFFIFDILDLCSSFDFISWHL